MKTVREFLKEQRLNVTDDDLFMDCDLTWDTIIILMQMYGQYREDHAPLPQHIQEALNSEDGTYRP